MNVYIFWKVFQFSNRVWNWFLLAPFSFFVMFKSIWHIFIKKSKFFFQTEMCVILLEKNFFYVLKKIKKKKFHQKKFFINKIFHY